MYFIIRVLILLILLISCSTNSYHRVNSNSDINFYESDLKNFWEAFDLVKKQGFKNCPQIFKSVYQNRASTGLKDFYELRIESNKKLCTTIKKHFSYYDYFRNRGINLKSFSPEIKKAYHKLKTLYPQTSSIEIYYLIGRTSSAGTIKENRNLIGLEMFVSGDEKINEKVIPKNIKAYKLSFKKFPELVIHEIIHTQQKYVDANTLLGGAIGEGVADFLTELVMGTHPNKAIYEYGYANEKKVWKKFKKQMNGDKISDFLYNSSTSKNPDLGYFVGYKIAESYYQNAEDKQFAIKEILNIKDFKQFYKNSGYNP